MAKGRLGVAALSANADTTVYTVPVGMVATLNFSVTNRGQSDTVVNVAISTSGAPTTAEYVEYSVVLPASGVLERTALVASAGERVVVRSSTTECSVRVHGFEEAA